MSLSDFMRELQENDTDVVYSKPPEESIQVIPPSKPGGVIMTPNQPIKVIPPKDEHKPQKIKFKLNVKKEEQEQPKKLEVIIPKKTEVQQKQQEISQEIQKPIQNIQNESDNTVKNVQNKQDSAEILFKRSETVEERRSEWFEYYNKALNSKKDNYITRKCKKGRFMITPDGELQILSDFDTYNKTSNDVLKEQWF